MSDDPKPLSGPDLREGIALSSLQEGTPLLAHGDGEAIVVVRRGDRLDAIGATCSHYGGPLAEGVVSGGTIRCPWHHACFELASGKVLGAPALEPLPCYDLRVESGLVKLQGKRAPVKPPAPPSSPSSVVIIGAGAAGAACAETLRREGYEGSIHLVGAEAPGPVDRPNLSKDFLAGSAPEEWIPLRTREFYDGIRVELLAEDPVENVDVAKRSVRLKSGRELSYGALVVATGAEPITLTLPGADQPHVRTLRTLGDTRAIIALAGEKKRAVIIGAGFIGLEVAASLRKRGLEVTVVAPDAIPLARVVGDEVGAFVREVHEQNGVAFRLGRKPARIERDAVVLDDGASLSADLVVVGVGVRPRLDLAERAGLRIDRGIVVDEALRTSAPDVWAAGDVARFPYQGAPVRIEHWALAERHGQAVARIILGLSPRFSAIPFFWSQHHDVTLSMVGHAEAWDSIEVRGDLAKRDATIVYRQAGRVRQVATIGRDRAGLLAEVAMELGDDGLLEEALR